jgi:uncharacterized protein (UPF0335 family)
MSETNGQLRSLIERIERLNSEIKDRQEDRKEVFLEARNAGFHVKAMRRLIRERGEDADERAALEAEIDILRDALGALADSPLGDAVLKRRA